MYSFGVRLPLASADNGSALMVGRLADPMYMGAWAADNIAVDANVMYFKGGESGIAPYLQGGVEVLYDTDAPDGADTTEITVPFILGAVMPMESGGIMAGLAGNYWVTEDDGYTSDNPWLYGAVGYQFSAGSVMPEIWLALPLSSDYGEIVDFMLSIGVGFNMP